MELSPEERGIFAGARGEAAKRALEYQLEVGRFWGARRLVPVTNVHMMGDIEVMGDAGRAASPPAGRSTTSSGRKSRPKRSSSE